MKSRSYAVRKEYKIQAVNVEAIEKGDKAEEKAQRGKFAWRWGMSDIA
jgi:hypothetical protein